MLRRIFCGYVYSLIWLNVFVKQVNREEKVTLIGRIDILYNKLSVKKKYKTVSFLSTNKESMVGQLELYRFIGLL